MVSPSTWVGFIPVWIPTAVEPLQAIWFSNVDKVTDLSASVSDLPSPILRRHVLLLGLGGVWLAAKPRQSKGIKSFIALVCSALQSLNHGRTRRGAEDGPCDSLSWAHYFAWDHLPHSEFLWQVCQHLILLPFSFSYFTLGAWYVAGPDKNKFIRMQTPENLEYIPVKGPWGQQRNHL